MANKEQKAQAIDKLQEVFAKSSVGVLTDYRGLTTAQLTQLRRKLQESGAEYQVVKNTLARLAAGKSGKKGLSGSLEGPVGIAFGYGDVAIPAKVVSAYITETKSTMTIKGGFLGDRTLTAAEVKTLATLPAKEVLIAMLIGQVQSPLTMLVSCLNSPMRGLVGVLQARIRQMEGA